MTDMRQAKLLVAVSLLALCAGSAFALPMEWLLVRGGARENLIAMLETEERFDVLNFLEAVWEGDFEDAEAAARILVDTTHDPEVARCLAGYLRRTGREDEADQIEPPCPRKLRSLALQAVNLKVSSHRPVVFLHGYNGDAATWSDMVSMFLASDYEQGDLLVFDYKADFDAGVDTPIETIALHVVQRVRDWLRQRAGLSSGDVSHDAELPAPDWLCHSMGGLVYRVVLKEAPELVHRCVDFGTPHFGQGIGDYEFVALWTGYPTEQMSHGSSFLWNLAADWHYHGRRTDDILFVVGAATTDRLLDFEDELAQDGLVNTFSATLLTQADGAAFAARTFFVNRIHSELLAGLYKDKFAGLVSLPRGRSDPVFRLAYGYLNDAEYFADGAVPANARCWRTTG